jgi:hypothetical protein
MHAVAAGDGTYSLQPTPDGPERPHQNKQVRSSPFMPIALQPTLSNSYLTLTYDRVDRPECNLKGRIKGLLSTILIDTGATEYNYVSREFAERAKLHQFPLRHNVTVKSIHGQSQVNKYVLVDCDLLYKNNVNLITLKRIPCIVLDSCPRDLIIGLPTIVDNDLISKLRPFYEELSLDFDLLYQEMFPRLTQATESDLAHVPVEPCPENFLDGLAGVATLRSETNQSINTTKDGYLTTSV